MGESRVTVLKFNISPVVLQISIKIHTQTQKTHTDTQTHIHTDTQTHTHTHRLSGSLDPTDYCAS